MIKAQCPKCGEYMKAKDWKQGMFDNCVHCGKRFKWKDTKKVSWPDFKSKISYDLFSDLLRHDIYFLSSVLEKEFNIAIGSRWIDNNLLEYYCHEYRASEPEYDLVAIFNRINEETKDLCEKLYQRWMELFR